MALSRLVSAPMWADACGQGIAVQCSTAKGDITVQYSTVEGSTVVWFGRWRCLGWCQHQCRQMPAEEVSTVMRAVQYSKVRFCT